MPWKSAALRKMIRNMPRRFKLGSVIRVTTLVETETATLTIGELCRVEGHSKHIPAVYINKNGGTIPLLHHEIEVYPGDKCPVCLGEKRVRCTECAGIAYPGCPDCLGEGITVCFECEGDGTFEAYERVQNAPGL